MSSASAIPSKKFSWIKKMDAKINKSLKDAPQNQNDQSKQPTKQEA